MGDVEKKIRNYYRIVSNVDADTPSEMLIKASESGKVTGAKIIPFSEFKNYTSYTGNQATQDALRDAKDTDLVVPTSNGFVLLETDGLTNKTAFKKLLQILGFSASDIDLYTKNLKFS